MRQIPSAYGTLQVGRLEDTFRQIVATLRDALAGHKGPITVGLSGGSTPKAFYQWAVREKALPEEIWKNCVWMTSDERHVALSSDCLLYTSSGARLFALRSLRSSVQ